MIGLPPRPAQPEDFWLPVVVVLLGNCFAFIFCSVKKDNSWIDVFWGLTFCTPIYALLILYAVTGVEIFIRPIVVAVLVSIWAYRLAWHIGARHTREDYRYVDMRTRWMEGGVCEFYTKAFVYIFMMQGLLSLVTNSASLFIVIYTINNELDWTLFVGTAIWLFGFIFECVGDAQLKSHIADKTEGKKKFIEWGLWRYTRHPNYFGEAVLWYGIWIIACGIQWGWATIFAPLTINLLVRYISGVPLLEAKYKDRLDWQKYCHETAVFIPWFVNKEPAPELMRASE